MTTLNHASVTLDHSAFAIADKDGFKMYQLNPLHFRMYKDYGKGDSSRKIVENIEFLSEKLVKIKFCGILKQ